MIEPYTSKVKTSLKKVQGQIKLIEKMIEDRRYCVEIAQQVNAATGLLKQANNLILESHMLTCGVEKLNTENENDRLDFVKEFLKTFNVTNR